MLLLTAPYIFGYREKALIYNDLISGCLIFFLSLWWIFKDAQLSRYTLCFIGVWLQFAPLAFWAKNPVIYALDTVAGILLIVLTLVIPDIAYTKEEAIPPGWSYNPSSWSQRVIIVLCAALCSTFARYLGAYELGYIDSLWEPLFGNGTLKVVNSSISKSFPVADAALGALAYTLDILFACHGDSKRWVQSPWMVLIFALLIIPLGVVSIVLMILQPVVLHTWCTLCLTTVFFMLILVAFTIDEVIPTVQLLCRVKQKEQSVWKAIWRGVNPTQYAQIIPKGKTPISALLHGVSFPLSLLGCICVAIWLSATPSYFQCSGALRNVYYLAGAVSLTFSLLACAEPLRILRYLNMLVGGLLIILTFLLADNQNIFYNGLVASLVLGFLSKPLGKIRNIYGSYRKYIR